MSSTIIVKIENNDLVLGFNKTGTRIFTLGVDDTDANKLKISTTGLGTNDRLIVDSSGNITIPNSLTITNTLDVTAK